MLRALFQQHRWFYPGSGVNLVRCEPHVENPTASQWFNAAAFIQPPDFTLGDGPRAHPSLRNPGFQNFDMSLTKRVPVTNEWTLELIMEAFNALNYAISIFRTDDWFLGRPQF
jgi:hypothetical protein